jgi:hypothetical protein
LIPQIEGLERNKLTGTELLSRVQLLENRVDAATAVAGTGGADRSSTSSDPDAVVNCGKGNSGGTGLCSAAAGSGSHCSAGGSGFSPFAQAKLIQQVAALEQQTRELQVSSAQMAFRTEKVVINLPCLMSHCVGHSQSLSSGKNTQYVWQIMLAAETAVQLFLLARCFTAQYATGCMRR